ncbi:MAG: transposase [Proteobacteria bacterium]|nr:transposase [Pseudomonadota bacterium]
MEAIRDRLPADTEIELWWQDEARVGQKNKIARRWARCGTRPRAPHDQRTKSAYIFGATCPERGVGAALVLPRCNTQAMQWYLEEISSWVSPGAHAIVMLDQAGCRHGARQGPPGALEHRSLAGPRLANPAAAKPPMMACRSRRRR